MTIGIGRKFILASLILPLVLTSGCSSPKVSHTSISGEIKDIEHWRLEWVGAESATTVDIPGLFEKSKYTAAEYCIKYVEEVKHNLARDYQVSFAENYPEIGLIQVELTGEKLAAEIPPSFGDDPSGRLTWEDRGGSTKAVYKADEGRSYRLFAGDEVRRVRLSFFNLEGNLSGDVFIGEFIGDKVKPDFVARVIYEIIRTGRYKGTRVVPVAATVEGK